MNELPEQEPEEPEDEQTDKLPDRPIECSECKKPIAIRYTEIVNNHISETCMCADCPHLQRHLKGMPPPGSANGSTLMTGITCGDCGTTLEAIQVGHPLGCSHCYEVFADIIVDELHSRSKLPPNEENIRKPISLHIGRSPGETMEMSPSLRLIALNEALSETLKREDYEQAAMIRDQINALSEENDKEKPKNGKK